MIKRDWVAHTIKEANRMANYVHGYQQKVGSWVDNFLVEAENNDFSLSHILVRMPYRLLHF